MKIHIIFVLGMTPLPCCEVGIINFSSRAFAASALMLICAVDHLARNSHGTHRCTAGGGNPDVSASSLRNVLPLVCVCVCERARACVYAMHGVRVGARARGC